MPVEGFITLDNVPKKVLFIVKYEVWSYAGLAIFVSSSLISSIIS